MAEPRQRGGKTHDTVSTAGAFLRGLQNELGGSIPFERFMREALYHPSFGYYSARIHTVGRRGDFSTMATLDRSLGAGIAGWIEKHGACDVIEIGAGSGQLARDILNSLGWWKRLRLRYHIVEVSTPLREAQKKLLRGRRVTWHESLPAALDQLGGRAHIFSNELVDAFPCRVFECTDTDWQELHVRIEGGRCQENLQPSTLPESMVFHQPFKPGQRVEVHESYRRWLQDWAPKWKSGAMLTIDYGDTMPALYHRRPAGSLRGYAAHQVLTGTEIYQAPGRCDLTADVNFSDLEIWGEQQGWRCLSHSTLADFLAPHLPTRFQAAAEAFRVFEQSPDRE
jgi:SAM-dependent MidA family methyltransferase